MKNFKTVQAAKRFCTANRLGCHNPLIVAKDGVFFVFLLGEPVGEFDHEAKFTRWKAEGYEKITRFQNLTGKWKTY